MTVIQRISKNIGFFLIGQLISYILNFFFVMYTARYLGAEGFGILSFALALTGIFGIFTDLGLKKVTTREVARDKSSTKKYLGNIAMIKIILVTVTFALIVLFINLLDYPEKTIRVVYIFALSIIFNAFSQLFYAVFQAHEKMEYESLGHILNSILLLAGALFAISNGLTVLAFAYLYLFISIVIFGYSFFISIWRFSKPKIEIDLGFWITAIKEGVPFGLIGVSEIIYHWIDTVMLSMMKGDTVVGWYNAAYRLFLITLFIPNAVNMAVFPVMSRSYISSEDSLKLIHQKYFKYMSMIGIFIGVGTTLFADKIILLIFGNEYRPSIIALQILIWSSVLIFVNGAFVRLFECINKQIIITKIAGAAAVLNVLLNLLLIPKYSYIGASVATVLSELLITLSVIVAASQTKYKIQNSVIVTQLIRLSFSGLMMGIFIFLFNVLNLLFLIVFSTLIYLGVMYFIKGFDKEDISLIRRLKG